ncbi:hypothetical protein V496_05812 [Pseudogymnoascus sp. VKM F-4515 (FW-2607)]|nr:hypothetical protein V496_05812 [Pseudogymnoascus sp. VKM F-4515 (FW-2607)]
MITPIGQAFVVGGLVCQGHRTRTECRPATSFGCKGHRISIYCDTTSYSTVSANIQHQPKSRAPATPQLISALIGPDSPPAHGRRSPVLRPALRAARLDAIQDNKRPSG